MRADRLISILLLLQAHVRLTARELAARLEVSQRTIHRDMDALSAAGIPVRAERGAEGGWSLLENYRTSLTGLNADEIQTLFLAQPAHVLADLGLQRTSEAARLKLQAALPAWHHRQAEFARQRLHVDSAGWHSSTADREPVPSLCTLQEALWQERKIRMTYGRDDGQTPVERAADPLGLVAKGSAWYLVASVEGETRTYRVSRIVEVKLTDQSCTRPPGFDLARFWEESKARFVASLPRYQVVVRAQAGILTRMRMAARFSRIEHAGPPGAQGWARVEMRFDSSEVACEFVLSFGSKIEVLEPEELRAVVKEETKKMIAVYEPK
jgi:predicted DNA-binding transcriptional regulator YafY